MTKEQMIYQYLDDMDKTDPAWTAVDDMSYAAADAFAHMVDGDATVEHLAAYRAWMTYCRMTHMSDSELAGARAVAADWAQKLGVE